MMVSFFFFLFCLIIELLYPYLCRETMLDPTAVFALVFGSELFEDYIGHLAVASMASSELADDSDTSEKLRDRLQTCAHKVSTAFGVDIQHTIGYLYVKQAAQELGKKAIYLGVPFLTNWVRNKGHIWKSQVTATKGAFQLLQLQEDIQHQSKIDGNGPRSDVESHILSNKDTLMNSLWKLNVVDIEVTLLHVCQMVLKENNVKKEEVKARALALKNLGKIFQVLFLLHSKEKPAQSSITSRRKSVSDVYEDASSSDSSSDEDSPRALSYRTPAITQLLENCYYYVTLLYNLWQGIGRLFRCLCNPAYDVDDEEIMYKGK
ncbi:hypothetical protein IFM89_022816 [Coptis chinensis]|uniref:DNAJ-containing protein X-domain domain-containing protein n=1 Tax=Coptis chinensis TaxID=261450 RepID=A0A835HNQ2_9MAGN|nr:hypothetical protein IFM89_022816 [Coptis chinensis]